MPDEKQQTLLRHLGEALAAGTLVKCSLGSYRGGEPDLKQVLIRPVTIRSQPMLSFVYRYATRDITKNLPPPAGIETIAGMLAADFHAAHLFTTAQDVQWERRPRGSTLACSPPTHREPPSAAHDRRKRRCVEPHALYLQRLGVTDTAGNVLPRMQAKFRQIDKFIEIVDAAWAASPLAERKQISVVDMGCGKGYLTFAVHDYFTSVRGMQARVTGVEQRSELVAQCSTIAREAGCAGLEFHAGRISDYPLGPVDMLIALHACDTATDDALQRGVAAGAAIIICAPCCHKQVRPQMAPDAALQPALKHGILLERQAEIVTDALRALLLEYAGYTASVFEFIASEHTDKNIMILAVKRRRAQYQQPILNQIAALKRVFGIREHYLEPRLLGSAPATSD